MDSKLKWLMVPLAAFVLSACEPAEDTTDEEAGTGGGTTTASTGEQIALGSGSGNSFSRGNISSNITSLTAGGSASLTVNLVDTNSSNALYTSDSVEVSFSSTCVSAGKASFSNPTVATSSGTASTTYTAEGCVGSDVIVANVETASARVTLNVAPSDVNAIGFTGNDFNSSIAYTNSGNSGQANFTRVEFMLFDQYGYPVEGQEVGFTISSTDPNHGVELSVTSDVSDESGLVDVLLNAGTAPANVRVVATFTPTSGDPISTQSLPIAVNTGPADAESFSLAVAGASVASAFNTDGKTTSLTVRLADRNNNPVADGTVVSFWTEYGYIEPACETSEGSCSVTWISSGTRPLDGLSTVVAYTVGEDSFIDAGTRNGIYDVGEAIINQGELFFDLNYDKSYTGSSFTDAGSGLGVSSESYFDYNSSGTYDSTSAVYRGALCSSAAKLAGHCQQSTIQVWGASQLALNTKFPSATPNTGSWDVDWTVGSYTVTVTDRNGNYPPEGTTLAFQAIGSASATIDVTGNIGAVGESGPGGYDFFVAVSEVATPGTFKVVVTFPDGDATIYYVDFI